MSPSLITTEEVKTAQATATRPAVVPAVAEVQLKVKQDLRMGREHQQGRINWITSIAMGLFHVGAIAALFFFSWTNLAVAVVMVVPHEHRRDLARPAFLFGPEVGLVEQVQDLPGVAEVLRRVGQEDRLVHEHDDGRLRGGQVVAEPFQLRPVGVALLGIRLAIPVLPYRTEPTRRLPS